METNVVKERLAFVRDVERALVDERAVRTLRREPPMPPFRASEQSRTHRTARRAAEASVKGARLLRRNLRWTGVPRPADFRQPDSRLPAAERLQPSGKPNGADGDPFAMLAGMPPEIVIGRALAAFVHPRLAWRVLTPAGRLFVTGAYFVIGYVGVLSALILFG